MGVLDWFKQKKITQESRYKELGSFSAQFSNFGKNAYASDIVRSCIRPLADHTSKANAVCTDKSIEKVLNINPNQYMNGVAFLKKVRTNLELNNNAFIYIMRDKTGKANGFYPIPYQTFEAVESANRLFVKFYFSGEAARTLTLPWEDLVPLRKDYNKSDIAGDNNNAIIDVLEQIHTANEGTKNAIKATANLRGILKSTKAMLSPADIKKNKDEFVKDYLSLENSGGIASLDATQEFTPIKMEPVTANFATIKEYRENVYRYYGISEEIIMSKYSESQMEAFYDSRIEPFLIDLSLELTKKVFTDRERAFGAQIVYESNRIQYASTATKLNMVALVDRGALTPNEWRAIFNLAPVDGGDIPLRRLDTITIDQVDSELINDIDGEEETQND